MSISPITGGGPLPLMRKTFIEAERLTLPLMPRSQMPLPLMRKTFIEAREH